MGQNPGALHGEYQNGYYMDIYVKFPSPLSWHNDIYLTQNTKKWKPLQMPARTRGLLHTLHHGNFALADPLARVVEASVKKHRRDAHLESRKNRPIEVDFSLKWLDFHVRSS